MLRRLGAADVLGRLPALELLVRACVASGDRGAATNAFEQLAAAGRQVGTPYVLGRLRLVAIDVCLSHGDADAARQAGEDAIDRLTESSAPYDVAVARLGLARALRALGRESQAIAEGRTAREAFAELGAERHLQRAEALLAAPPVASSRPAAPPAASPAAASARPASPTASTRGCLDRCIGSGLGGRRLAARRHRRAQRARARGAPARRAGPGGR